MGADVGRFHHDPAGSSRCTSSRQFCVIGMRAASLKTVVVTLLLLPKAGLMKGGLGKSVGMPCSMRNAGVLPLSWLNEVGGGV